jgi:hypothetical protein
VWGAGSRPASREDVATQCLSRRRVGMAGGGKQGLNRVERGHEPSLSRTGTGFSNDRVVFLTYEEGRFWFFYLPRFLTITTSSNIISRDY